MAKGRYHALPGTSRIVYMKLMSWGGETVEDVAVPNLPEVIYSTSRAVWQEGVFHGDERRPNIVWNEMRGSISSLVTRFIMQLPQDLLFILHIL